MKRKMKQVSRPYPRPGFFFKLPPGLFFPENAPKMHFSIFYMYNFILQERVKERKKGSACALLKMHFACTLGKKDALSETKMHYRQCMPVHKSACISAKVHGIVHEKCIFFKYPEKHK